MMTKIFLTGASGYIGGEVLYLLHKSDASLTRITCLNRDPIKGTQISKAYPHVRIVQGDLDSTSLIEKEAADADVVVHLADTKHLASAKAIAAAKPKAWIQMTGATVYAGKEIAEGRFGEASDQVWADERDESEILEIIRGNPGRAVEQLVLAQDPAETRTAIVVGPLIYGLGRGPCHTRSIQAPETARVTLELGHGFRILDGENAWSHVHVADIASLICRLIRAALGSENIGWNERGVYHAESGAVTFGEMNAWIAEEAYKQDLLTDTRLERIEARAIDELSPHMSILCGTNATTLAEKARKSLGWRAEASSLLAEIPDMIRREHEALVPKTR